MSEREETASRESALHALDYIQVIRNRWKEIFLTFLIVFATSAIITFLQAPVYKSVTTFDIKLPQSVIDLAPSSGEDVVSRASGTDSYITSQFEVMVSPECLKFAVRKLNLGKEWGVSDNEALSRLSGMILVTPRRNTNMVDVEAKAQDPRLAQNVAEAVADAYRKRREMEEGEYVGIAIKKLKEALQQQSIVVENKTRALKTFIKGDYILNPWESGPSTSTASLPEEALRNAMEKSRELKQQEEELNTHVTELNKLKDDQLLSYVVNADLLSAEGIGSSNLRDLKKQYDEKQEERKTLRIQGYGENHQKMKMFEESTARLEERLNEGLITLKSSLARRLDIVRTTIKSWDKVVHDKESILRQKVVGDQDYLFAKREYDDAQERYKELEKRYFSETSRLSVPRIPIVIYAHPTLPSRPDWPKVPLNLMIGALGGLFLGILIAFVLEYFDTTVKTMEEVEKVLDAPVMGVIPKNISDLIHDSGQSPDIEAYRILRTNIELSRENPDELSLAFVSGSAGEGKTTTLANLAFTCAQGGYTTLMLDADLRRSSLHKHFDIDPSVGLSDYLTSDLSLEDVIQKTDYDNLFILPAGPTPIDPSGLLNSQKMLELISEAKKRFDIVLVDSPPILGVSDAAVITSAVDMTMMVVQPRKLPAKALLRQKQVILSSGGHLAGIVMNNVDITSDHQYQYYTTYYTYYSPDKTNPVDQDKATPSRSSKRHSSKPHSKSAEKKDTPQVEEEDLY
ncbi:MAG: polysaccharide biosynthesis tyrosine autokinase [Akkermansia sp.]